MARKAAFGSIRKINGGRFQARYTGPDRKQHTGPHTFRTKGDASAYLATVHADLLRQEWSPTEKRAMRTFAAFSEAWLAGRELKPRSREHYRRLLDQHLLPEFGSRTLRSIEPGEVRAWYQSWGSRTPTLRAHAYGLLRTILASAVEDRLLDSNPAHVRGGGTSKRVKRIQPATLPELETIVERMPEDKGLMVLLAAWCALRFGELTELRRKDIDPKHGVIRIRRAVVRVDGGRVVGEPKSDAGLRDVAIPPHLMPAVREHLLRHAGAGAEGLLFPAHDGTSHLAPSSLYKTFYAARAAAGRPDLRFHDLRHTGAVLAAGTGATLAELMSRLGHSSPAAALRYQHASADRDRAIAEALSALATDVQ